MMSWHGNAVLLVICQENTPITDGFPLQRASNAANWLFVVNLNKNEQSSCCWFETPLWRHCNVSRTISILHDIIQVGIYACANLITDFCEYGI